LAQFITTIYKAITEEQVRQVLTAGSKGQTVLDDGPGGHSVFTGRFIEALENVEDYITARELGQQLKKRVYGDAAARGHTQRPVDGEIYGTGDFVFIPDLEKRNRDLKAEVDFLETEMTRLKRLKEDALKAKDDAKQREIGRQQLIKEAELKQAQIRQKQKQEAAERQRLAALEAEQHERQRKQQEREREERLASLRLQAEKMRKELAGDLTEGATMESAIAEMKRIQKQIDTIEQDFSVQLSTQTQSIIDFYNDKIMHIMDIPWWDREFETESEYNARVAEAENKAIRIRDEKIKKITELNNQIAELKNMQLKHFKDQMESLKKNQYSVPTSRMSFEFLSYNLDLKKMFGQIALNNRTYKFSLDIPKEKARVYRHNPELLVAEAWLQATMSGPKLTKIVFYGPGNQEKYVAIIKKDS